MKDKGKVQRFYFRYEAFIKGLLTSKTCHRLKTIVDETFESKNLFVKILSLVLLIAIGLTYFNLVMFSVPFIFPGLLGMNYLREKYNINYSYEPASKIACVAVGIIIYIVAFVIVWIIYYIVHSI